MRFRPTFVLLLVLAATAGLAFGPLASTPEDTGQRLDDGKFRALQRGDLDLPGHHDLKEAKAADALAARESQDLAVPAPVPCTEGFAGPYTCENIDLASIVPLAELGGAAGNDSWGWTDPEEGNEIAIMGTGLGTAFIDISEPTMPEVLGHVPSESTDDGILWRDVKVNDDHAFIVSENGDHGMQVFDLTRLREHYGSPNPARELAPDAVDDSFGSAHNLAINTDTDTAYAVGADVCSGGLHMIDISDPTDTSVAGCFDEDGYTHDVQCVLYAGPDDDHNGSAPGEEPHEICFASNGNSGGPNGVAIVDVTDKSEPELLAKVGYSTAGYTHQGWLTPDQRWFVFNDELDEQNGTVANTTTYVLDVEDLDLGDVPPPVGDAPGGPITSYSHDTTSTDHNLYITAENDDLGATDELIWEANYNAGLRILTYTEGTTGLELTEVGKFDIDSEADFPHYGDAWNVYPYFESGTIIVSNLAQGLFVLQPDYEALTAGSDG